MRARRVVVPPPLLDQDLRRFTTVWAAGGTPFSVFPIAPPDLQRITGAEWDDIGA